MTLAQAQRSLRSAIASDVARDRKLEAMSKRAIERAQREYQRVLSATPELPGAVQR